VWPAPDRGSGSGRNTWKYGSNAAIVRPSSRASRFDVCQLSCSTPKFDCWPAGRRISCSTQNRSGMMRRPPPSGELAGVAGPTTTVVPSHDRSNCPGVPIAAIIVTCISVPSLQRM
jgi:hypothetical protein